MELDLEGDKELRKRPGLECLYKLAGGAKVDRRAMSGAVPYIRYGFISVAFVVRLGPEHPSVP